MEMEMGMEENCRQFKWLKVSGSQVKSIIGGFSSLNNFCNEHRVVVIYLCFFMARILLPGRFHPSVVIAVVIVVVNVVVCENISICFKFY